MRVGRIELPSHPWQGRVLPLNHTRNVIIIRKNFFFTTNKKGKNKNHRFSSASHQTGSYAPVSRASDQSNSAPAKTRTWTVGFEDRSDIRFTTGAYSHILH